MNRSSSALLGSMPMGRLLVKMAGPIALSMFVQAMYNLVDSIFVAAISESALNALSIAFTVQILIGAIGLGLGTGASSVLAKALGEQDSERVKLAAGTSVAVILMAWLVFLLFGLFGTRAFYRLVTTDAEIISLGSEYCRIMTVFSFGMMMQQVFERQLQATGKSLLSMIAQLSGAVTNLILDPIMIFGYFGCPAMGVRGAAIASAIGQLISAGLAITFCLTRNKEIPLKLRYFRCNLPLAGEMLRIGAGTGAVLVFASVMTFGVNRILIGLSTSATAVYGAFTRIQSIITIVIQGLGSALIPVISFNYGIRSQKRIRQAFRISMAFTLIYTAIFTAVIVAAPQALLRIFSATEGMYQIGIPAFRRLATGFLFAGISMTASTMFQVFHRWKLSILVSVFRQIVPLLPLLWLFAASRNPRLVWWAFPISEFFAATICVAELVRIFKHTVSRIEDAPANADT